MVLKGVFALPLSTRVWFLLLLFNYVNT